MKTKMTLIAAVLLVALSLSACGSKDSDSTATPASSPAASEAVAGGETKEITLNASNWKFDQTEIKAHKGDTIKLTLKSTEGMHAIKIDDLKVDLKNGETKEIKLTEAGTFEFHCSIQCGQGHDNMSGNIIVE